MRQEIIQQALTERAAEGVDSSAIADATVHVLRLLHAELESLVGGQAVRALHARSVHLTRSSIGWTWPAAAHPQGELLSFLRADLVARSPAQARKAAETILLTFADLLISLIGEPLTQRLLRTAWGVPQDGDKTSQEKP